MYLPTRSVHTSRSLIVIGCHIMDILTEPTDIDTLWRRYQRRCTTTTWPPIDFDWFALAVAALYSIHLVEHDNGVLRMSDVSP